MDSTPAGAAARSRTRWPDRIGRRVQLCRLNEKERGETHSRKARRDGVSAIAMLPFCRLAQGGAGILACWEDTLPSNARSGRGRRPCTTVSDQLQQFGGTESPEPRKRKTKINSHQSTPFSVGRSPRHPASRHIPRHRICEQQHLGPGERIGRVLDVSFHSDFKPDHGAGDACGS